MLMNYTERKFFDGVCLAGTNNDVMLLCFVDRSCQTIMICVCHKCKSLPLLTWSWVLRYVTFHVYLNIDQKREHAIHTIYISNVISIARDSIGEVTVVRQENYKVFLQSSYTTATQQLHGSYITAARQLHHSITAATLQRHSSYTAATRQLHSSITAAAQQCHSSRTAATQQRHSSVTAAAQQLRCNTNWLSIDYFLDVATNSFAMLIGSYSLNSKFRQWFQSTLEMYEGLFTCICRPP